MIPVAIYLRVSTEEQRERQSIATQRQYAESYLRLNQIPVYAWYIDDGVSGAIPVERRPEGARLMADAQAGKFRRVLIYRVDRLSRSILDLLRTAETLERSGVAIRSMTEPFETDTPIGKFVLAMLGSIAQLEKETIRERTMLGAARIAREGKWNGGPAPYGYVVVEGRLEIEPQAAAQVADMFRLYLEGQSARALAKYLTAAGVEPPATHTPKKILGKWDATSILWILRNPVYTGERVYRRKRSIIRDGRCVGFEDAPPEYQITSTSPAIVTPEQFAAVQRKITANTRGFKVGVKHHYLLGRVIRCGFCGAYFGGTTAIKPDKTIHYYRCRGKIVRGEKVPCDAPSLSGAKLDEKVWRRITRFAQNPGPVLEQLAARAREAAERAMPLQAEQESLDELLAGKATERERIIRLLRRGLITEAEAEQQLEELAAEVQLLEGRRASTFTAQQRAQAVEEQLVRADAVLRWLRESIDLDDAESRAAAVQALVEEIVVEPRKDGSGHRVRVRFRFQRLTPDEGVSPHSTDVNRESPFPLVIEETVRL